MMITVSGFFSVAIVLEKLRPKDPNMVNNIYVDEGRGRFSTPGYATLSVTLEQYM